MGTEQLLLPLEFQAADVSGPVPAKVYRQIIKARTVHEVCGAFRGKRIRIPVRRQAAVERTRKSA